MNLPKHISITAVIAGVDCEVACEYDYDPGDERNGEELTVTTAFFEDQGSILDDASEHERALMNESVLEKIHAYVEYVNSESRRQYG